MQRGEKDRPYKMSRLATVLFSALILLAISGGAVAVLASDAGTDDDPAAKWLETVTACYENINSIQADFVQERFDKLGAEAETMAGVLQARAGGLARLEYTTPKGRAVISDGKTVWAVDRNEKIAFRQSADKSPLFGVLDFLFKGGARTFAVRFLGGEKNPGRGSAVLELKPLDSDPFIERVALTLEEPCPCVKRVLVVDRSGSVVRVTLTNTKTNVKIGRGRFTFSPGAGIRLVIP